MNFSAQLSLIEYPSLPSENLSLSYELLINGNLKKQKAFSSMEKKYNNNWIENYAGLDLLILLIPCYL